MNIVFMGTPTFAVPILKALHAQYRVVLVVTQPDRPTGRKRQLTPSPIKTLALSLDIPVFQPERIRTDYAPVIAVKPDLIVTAAYGQIIPEALLEAPPYGAVNVHGSLLPKLRGGAPIQRAIERCLTETGVTIMAMRAAMDAGAIIRQASIPIAKRETAGSLFTKLAPLGRDLLMETLPTIFSGSAVYRPQDDREATFAYTIKKAEERLDFSMSAHMIDAKIRAFHPAPNVYALDEKGQRIKIIVAEAVDHAKAAGAPGTVIALDASGLQITTGTGVLLVKELQPAGKKAMDVYDYMQGTAANRIKVGTILR